MSGPPPDRPPFAARLAGAPWALVSYRTGDGADNTGLLTSTDVRSIPGLEGRPLIDVVRDWARAGAALSDLDAASLPVLEDAQLDLPLRYPAKLLCAGANYHQHLREMGVPAPPDGFRPYFFFKPPTTTIVPDGADIPIEDSEEVQIDWEAELGVVIGRRTTRVSAAQAMSAVAGYVVLNDVTDRARLARKVVLAPPFAFDWVSAKALDASCPMGATFVPASLVADPRSLRIRLWVNDQLKQDSSTADMVYDVPRLIEAASETLTLEPGDVIATGTPAGVGAPRGEFLKPGDIMVAEITGVGRVTNRVTRRE